jgi:hypothetical protein
MFQICLDSIHSTPAPHRNAIALSYKDFIRMARAHGRDGGVREELAAAEADQSAGLTRSVAKTDRAMEAWYHPPLHE